MIYHCHALCYNVSYSSPIYMLSYYSRNFPLGYKPLVVQMRHVSGLNVLYVRLIASVTETPWLFSINQIVFLIKLKIKYNCYTPFLLPQQSTYNIYLNTLVIVQAFSWWNVIYIYIHIYKLYPGTKNFDQYIVAIGQYGVFCIDNSVVTTNI